MNDYYKNYLNSTGICEELKSLARRIIGDTFMFYDLKNHLRNIPIDDYNQINSDIEKVREIIDKIDFFGVYLRVFFEEKAKEYDKIYLYYKSLIGLDVTKFDLFKYKLKSNPSFSLDYKEKEEILKARYSNFDECTVGVINSTITYWIKNVEINDSNEIVLFLNVRDNFKADITVKSSDFNSGNPLVIKGISDVRCSDMQYVTVEM